MREERQHEMSGVSCVISGHEASLIAHALDLHDLNREWVSNNFRVLATGIQHRWGTASNMVVLKRFGDTNTRIIDSIVH